MNASTARRLPVLQGECKVSNEDNVTLTAVLGSCVAACLYDPQAHVGGMSHILLPGDSGSDSQSEYYGAYLMELLINTLMSKGARKQRMQAKLFGGARVLQSRFDIGRRNADFAIEFMQNEHIPIISQSLGGDRGRRLEYRAASGQVRQQFLTSTVSPAFGAPASAAKTDSRGHGDVELFG